MIALLLLLSIGAPPFVVSDSLFQTTTGVISLSSRSGWTYTPGDNPAYADPDFDDSAWFRTSPAEIRLGDDVPDSVSWSGTGWFRFRFTIDSTLTDIPLWWRVGTWGGLTIYLDGVDQGSWGRPHTDPDSVVHYNPLNRQASAPPQALVPGRTYILAMRLSNHQEPLTFKWLKTPNEIDPLIRLAKPQYATYIQNVTSQNLLFNVTWVSILTLLSLLFLLFWQLNRSNALIASSLLFTLLLTISQIANFLPGYLHVEHVSNVIWRFVFEIAVGVAIMLLAVMMSNVAGRKPPRIVYWTIGVIPILGYVSYQFSLGLVLWIFLILEVAVVVGFILKSSFSKLRSDAWIILTGIVLVAGNMLLVMFNENSVWYNNNAWIQFLNVSFIYFSIPVAMLIHITLSYTRLTRERNQKLEKEVAEATAHLKQTMDQLVQQEKLASLGQLTAGIAHEIKNPLNFVNNFASVSRELVDEALKDVASFRLSVFGEDSPLTTENRKQITNVEETLSDVERNLQKIHEHGTRADKIVKSMLLHSRGGSGKMEPTDLNSLIREYGNLAFHGMRAGKNPITVDVRYELDESIGKIPLVAEDFSRVILNLCNNAFDAMRDVGRETMDVGRSENRKLTTENILTLRSKRTPDAIVIEVEDNGPGIPDEIKTRILEPFFTTKKGTEGTGLGLSISMDIIIAHGGSLRIENAAPGAKFCIRLQTN